MLGWLWVVAGLGVVLHVRTHKRIYREARCGKCGYSREGMAERCPECGTLESDQRNVWRKKYRGVYAGVGVVAVMGGYLISSAPNVRRSGWPGFVPDQVVLSVMKHELRQVLTGNPDGHNLQTLAQTWCFRAYLSRVTRDSLSERELRSFTRGIVGLLESDEISIEDWDSCSWLMLTYGDLLGKISEQSLHQIARRELVFCRDWIVDEGTAGSDRAIPWWLGPKWTVAGTDTRRIKVEIEGRNKWTNHFAVRPDFGVPVGGERHAGFLQKPARDGYRVQISVTESRGGNDHTIFEHSKQIPVRIYDSWEDAPFPARTDVLQSVSDWMEACGPRVMGLQEADGTWRIVSPFWSRYLVDPEYAEIGFGMRVSLVINGYTVYRERHLLRYDLLEPFDAGGLHIRPDSPRAKLIPGVDFSRGDTVEVVIESDREMALLNRRATSYWEGRVVIPITKIETYPYPIPTAPTP